jgi:hypothetical protein
MKAWLRHAFEVEPPGAAEPTEAQAKVIDAVCRQIVRRRLVTPATLMLEMSRPLNYVSAQAMHFFQPILAVVTDTDGYDQFAAFLERRGSIEHFIRRLEELEQTWTT